MTPAATERLYLQDDHCFETDARVVAVRDDRLAFDGNHALKAYYISQDEFRTRDDLLRTLEAKPPVIGGQVRVVEIQGFDAQACGGTHVSATSEVGRFSIVRAENKGKINKRLHVRLDQAVARAAGR